MENYEKGDVQELEDKSSLQISESAIRMHVHSGSKIRNLMGFAMNRFKEPTVRQLTWNGQGDGITKTISCAEIMKRRIKGLHQITDVRYKKVIEYWQPKKPELDRLQVTRDIPAITILLSKDELDCSHPSYQSPTCEDVFWMSETTSGNLASQSRQSNMFRGPTAASSAEVPFARKQKGKRKGEMGKKGGLIGEKDNVGHNAKGRPRNSDESVAPKKDKNLGKDNKHLSQTGNNEKKSTVAKPYNERTTEMSVGELTGNK